MNDTKEKLRRAVKLYYYYQKVRIGIANKINNYKDFDSGLDLFGQHEKIFAELEKETLKYIKTLLEDFLLYKKLIKIKSVGEKVIAVLLAEVDIHKADTVSSLWKFCGLGVTNGKADRPEKNKKRCYNSFVKSKLLDGLGKKFLIDKNEYSKYYYEYKERKEKEGWGNNKMHRHRAAIRYMIKMFLIDVYKIWREIEGLPIREKYNFKDK